MKLETVNNNVEASGSFKKKAFSIKAGAKAFMVLSSTLYSNKIRAFVRELVCNASDSKKGGAEFKVTMPTVFEPTFKVRDFGTGISEENMFHIYTTYFESTKDNDDENIGGFGLGSKSPFAYTDSFEVTSYFNGKQTVYSVYLDNSEPNIVKVAEFPSDEPCGLEVTVPIKTEDFNTVIKESLFVLRDFKNFTCDNGQFDDYDHYPDENMFCLRNDYTAGGYALMGGILYPIPYEYYKGTWFEHMAKGSGAAIRFNIGELDISPSREQLSFDEDTKDQIHEKIDEVSKNDMSLWMGKIAIAKTLRQASRIIAKFSLTSDAKKVLKLKTVINNKTVLDFENHCNSGGMEFAELKYVRHTMRNNRLLEISRRRHSYGASKVNYCNIVDISRKTIDIIIRNDEKEKAKPLNFLNQLKLTDAIVLPDDKVQRKAVHDTLLDYYDESEIFYHFTTDYVKPVVEKSNVVRAPKKEKLYQYHELKNGNLNALSRGCVSLFKELEGSVIFYEYGVLYDIAGNRLVNLSNFANCQQWVIHNGIDCFILPNQIRKSTVRNKKLTDLEDVLSGKYNEAVKKLDGPLNTLAYNRSHIDHKIVYLINNYGDGALKKQFGADIETAETRDAYEFISVLNKFDYRYFVPSEIHISQKDHHEQQVKMVKLFREKHNDFEFAYEILEDMYESALNKHHKKLLNIIFN